MDNNEIFNNISENIYYNKDDKEDDNKSDIGEEDDMVKVSLARNCGPSVDTRFDIGLCEKVFVISTRELVEA